MIANSLEKTEECCFFYFKSRPANVAKKLSTIKRISLTNKAKFFFERTREIKRQIETVFSVISEPTKIVIHLARLNNSTINYYIYAISREHPKVEVVVHLIPHGLKAQRLVPLGVRSRLKLKGKRYIRKLFNLSFYDEVYDEYGFLSPITEKIYVIPGFEAEVGKYHKKIQSLPLGDLSLIKNKKLENKMLVIGQKNIANIHMSGEDLGRVTKKIKSFAENNDICKIDYLPHPRKKETMELYEDSFSIVKTNLSVEMLAIDGPYKIIISFSSTGLVFSKLLLGKEDGPRVVSVGTNLSRRQNELQNIIKVMKNIGIEMLDV